MLLKMPLTVKCKEKIFLSINCFLGFFSDSVESEKEGDRKKGGGERLEKRKREIGLHVPPRQVQNIFAYALNRCEYFARKRAKLCFDRA